MRQVLTPSASGCTLVSALGGTTRNLASAHASFNPNGAVRVRVFHKDTLQGAIAIKFIPYNWAGGDGRARWMFSVQGAAGNNIGIVHWTTNALRASVTDAAGADRIVSEAVNSTSLPANTVCRLGVRWNAGTLAGAFNSTPLGTLSGSGAAVMTALQANLGFGMNRVATEQGVCVLLSAVTLARDPGADGLAAIMASM